MSAKKFEKLIDLIINEDQDRANQLFHEIIVEKSREIYESIIDEDSIEGLDDEISADEEGFDDGEDMGDEEFGAEDFGDEEGEAEFGDEEDAEFGDEGEDLEDRVVDLEEKLDELMAEFEAQMGDEEEEFGDEEDMGMDDEEEFGDEDFGGEEDMGGDEEEFGDEVMESVQLKQVGGKNYNQFGKMGDDGQQTKSPGLQNPKRLETGGGPVKLGGNGESVPSSAKKPSNAYTKGEGKLSSSAKNVDGAYSFKEKGEAAPKPKTETIKAKSPVAESKRTTKSTAKSTAKSTTKRRI